MGGGVKKEFRFIKGKPVLCLCLETFVKTGLFSSVVITMQPEDFEEARFLLNSCPGGKDVVLVPGGGTRQQSVCKGLLYLKKDNPEWVMIHDGARPWVTPDLIHSIYEGMKKYGACVSVVQAHEAMKEMGSGDIINAHLSRTAVLAAQTPQAFRYAEILKAHERAAEEQVSTVDDTDLYHRYIGAVHTVPGDPGNRKITFNHDMENHMRIGFGWDIHRLVPGRPLVIGGVVIPFDKGEEGHSDGDALIHAVIDALLGASCLGDIGTHFPPSDPDLKDISSLVLLRKTAALVRDEGFSLGNIDCTVILEKPKLSPYMQSLKAALAKVLECPAGHISVKAKTREGLDAAGEGRAVEAHAVVLLFK